MNALDGMNWAAPGALLGPDDPPPATVVNREGRGALLLLCDHASNRIPSSLGDLGLNARERKRHIAWDIGALALAQRLSSQLDLPLVHANYSRLVIDLNRPLTAVDSVAACSDNVPVPGNLSLSDAARAQRVATLFRPYHEAIRGLLAARSWAGLVSVHSFTRRLGAWDRRWHIGVSAGQSKAWAARLVDAIGRSGDFQAGLDVPYVIDVESDFTVPVHGDARSLPAVLIEVRQDLLRDETGIAGIAETLSRALRACPPQQEVVCAP